MPPDTATASALARLCEPMVTARVLVVAAHPDDETIGAGAVLARGTDAHVALVTDGAPRDSMLWPPGHRVATRGEYAQVRREELRAALADAAIGADRIHLFDFTDSEAVDAIPAIVSRLVELFDRVKPDIVLTHAYEGGHVDHDATALAVHAAMSLAGRGRPCEMALYNGAGGGVHQFLPGGPRSRTFELDDRVRSCKSRMLARYESQQHYREYFATDIERYRCAPPYDFLRPPDPAAPPLYERTTAASGEEWRARARQAVAHLGLEDRLLGSASTPSGPLVHAAVADPESGAGRRAPLVSVIVRTTGRDTLAAAVTSIAEQTHPNLEILLVDVRGGVVPPHSLDRGGLVVRTCAAPGLDRPQAANVGLAAAAGEFVAFLDDDDWFHPEHVAALVSELRTAPNARVAYAGVEVLEWPDGGAPARVRVFDLPYDPVALLCANYIPLNAVLFERALLDEGCRFDEGFPVYEDWDFLIQLSRLTEFRKVPGIGAVYRWPPGSGIDKAERTAAAQERIFAKWRDALSRDDYVAIMRRGLEHTEPAAGLQTRIQELIAHLKKQDEELAQLRPCVAAQEGQLRALRTHLRAQDEELERLRPCVTAQESQLQELRAHLRNQDEELERLRALVRTTR